MTDDIGEWLDDLGLAKHAAVLAANGVDLDILVDLTEADLADLGINLGDRKRLLRAMATLGEPVAPAPGAATQTQAERRQLTVVFCDLVGSTELSRKLDPEDLSDVMRRYQDAVSGTVARYDGHVAKFLGDGMLAYFGWPQAHEDQAERAVHAGLEAIGATRDISVDGVALAARVGIATGLVVVGDLAGESDAIVGETPNLAARLQGLADPGELVIGQTTHRLIAGAFDCSDLGDHDLKGFEEPVQAWAVAGVVAADSRFESSHAARLTPLIGRTHELGLLRECWHRAIEGEGQVVLAVRRCGPGQVAAAGGPA